MPPMGLNQPSHFDGEDSGYFGSSKKSLRISHIKVSKMPSPFKISPEKTVNLGGRTGSFNMIGGGASPERKTKYFGVETNFGAHSELKRPLEDIDTGIDIYNKKVGSQAMLSHLYKSRND